MRVPFSLFAASLALGLLTGVAPLAIASVPALPAGMRHVTSVEGTWKLNQNKTPEIRARSAAALSQGDEASRRIAALIRGLPQD